MESITEFFREENDPFFKRGEARGEARGSLARAVAIAIEMRKDGIPVEQIAKFTKLSIEEIEKL